MFVEYFPVFVNICRDSPFITISVPSAATALYLKLVSFGSSIPSNICVEANLLFTFLFEGKVSILRFEISENLLVLLCWFENSENLLGFLLFEI